MRGFLRRWFIDGMSFMALGLFSSLIIGLIIDTIGTYVPYLESLKEIGAVAMAMTGAAIGAAIAYGLKAPPLVIFSVVVVSYAAYDMGGAAGSYIASIISIEIARLYAGRTKIDIIITPLFTIIFGYLIARFIGPVIGDFMTSMGEVIVFATDQRPFIMGMLVAVIFGITLTAPLSSAALALMLDISGLAAGAAVIGCCCHMVGLAVTGYRDNGFSGVLSIGLGTSMLQVPNVLLNPFILLPPVLASAIIAPVMTVFFPMENNAAGAGMGTSGLVGQIMTIETMGPSPEVWILILVFQIVLPAVVTLVFYTLLKRTGLIKEGDQRLKLGAKE
ncbi:PTS transporter subunit IIC [Salinicoccus hispanicus]|uniref:PTS sugar transporter subunit IIC n=1 Tax=Salinicoccus hispanicus TaxID=157225 RepID=A0A6N8TXZ2_9STAP|nr:PTS sugar transporter subunit IIC [Salinicoccus hispanicus]MXQ50513.1 PTS sugar transporter subunit IIC [Salinicoccus hispanicus]